MISVHVNGKIHRLDVESDTPLLWVLREQLNLNGAKYSCGIEECGACTVHVDGKAVLSCNLPVSEVDGKEIITIEGLKGRIADCLREAWIEYDVPQCGYCQPGQFMTAAALLKTNPNPNDTEIEKVMAGVICRCGTYQKIKKAIRRAAQRYRHEK